MRDPSATLLCAPQGLTLMDIEATQRLRARLRTPEAQARAVSGIRGIRCLPPCCGRRYAGLRSVLRRSAEATCWWGGPTLSLSPALQGKAERLMDVVGTISHGRGATLGARQLWARMSGTMRRLRRALHTLLQQVGLREGRVLASW